MKKTIAFAFSCVLMTACGGGSSSSSGSDDNNENNNNEQPANSPVCQIANDELNLANGASCTISEADAATYRLNVDNDISCDAGRIQIAGGLNIAGGASLNGLTFNCAAQ